MIRLLALSLVLAAAPACKVSSDRNRASEFAAFIDADAKCQALDSGKDEKPDTALCRAAGVIWFCSVKPHESPRCDRIGDAASAKPPTPPAAPPAPTPAPAPTAEKPAGK